MSVVSTPAEQRVRLYNVSWQTYLALLADTDQCGSRLTYDEGTLEIMSPSHLHENVKRLIGRMIEAFTEVMDIDICSGGSTTFKREDLQRGIEPDECYYIQHAAAVRPKQEIDPAIDPPPDLFIEVDISRSSIGKFVICAALNIPEVWRYDGESLLVYLLADDGRYALADQSSALPQFPLDELARLLDQRSSLSETRLIRSFRAWVKSNLVKD
jgi:Uma2 family endonuclease